MKTKNTLLGFAILLPFLICLAISNDNKIEKNKELQKRISQLNYGTTDSVNITMYKHALHVLEKAKEGDDIMFANNMYKVRCANVSHYILVPLEDEYGLYIVIDGIWMKIRKISDFCNKLRGIPPFFYYPSYPICILIDFFTKIIINIIEIKRPLGNTSLLLCLL